jgi:hypothetical protein
MIKLLRNLIRATTMISLLCGTNSHANNLIGENGFELSGESSGERRWVKVLTQLIRANMRSLCCNIEFTSYDGFTKKYASDFIVIENGQLIFDYNSLFIDIFGEAVERIPHLEDAKKLIQFIFKYVNTTLPGIATAATKCIFDLIILAKSNRDSLKDVWIKLNNYMLKIIHFGFPSERYGFLSISVLFWLPHATQGHGTYRNILLWILNRWLKFVSTLTIKNCAGLRARLSQCELIDFNSLTYSNRSIIEHALLLNAPQSF